MSQTVRSEAPNGQAGIGRNIALAMCMTIRILYSRLRTVILRECMPFSSAFQERTKLLKSSAVNRQAINHLKASNLHMNEPTTKQRLFDIETYSNKVRDSLKKLEQTQQPGQQSGKGSKTAVLEAAKAEIQELVKKGYTPKQIADALSSDVFGIIPKTITQLIGGKASSRKTKTKAGTSPARHTPARAANEQKPQANLTRNKPVTQLDDVE